MVSSLLASLLLATVLPQIVLGFVSHSGLSRTRCISRTSATTSPLRLRCSMSTEVDKYDSVVTPLGNSSVKVSVVVPPVTTQKYYDMALKELSIKQKIPGFSYGKGKRLPEQVIVNHYGQAMVKSIALESLTDNIVKKAIEGAGVKPIGQAELLAKPEAMVASLIPGQPLLVEVKLDVWPEVKFKGAYQGFTVQAVQPTFDKKRYEEVIMRLRERAVVLTDAPEGYQAAQGDSVYVDMFPFEVLPDGSRGDPLPALAGGTDVEIVMDTEKFMPGLMEGLLGVKVGEKREIRVSFPSLLSGPAQQLAGKAAVFDITCKDIQLRSLPELDDAFASSIRPGLTFAELDAEVMSTLDQEGEGKKKEARNKALEDALLKQVDVEIPETLVQEQARQKFAIMMTEMKNQDDDEEKIKSMVTQENFLKYKEIVRPQVNRTLALSLLLSDIAEKESIEVNPLEVEDQLELLRVEAKGENFDEAGVKDRIEATLQKEQVLQWIADRSTITYVEEAAAPK